MSRAIRKAACRFLQELGETPTVDSLKQHLLRQGYRVIPFHSAYNEGPTATILQTLNLQEQAHSSMGFTYANGPHRLVFLLEELSEQEQLLVLLHELGHICLGHLDTAPVYGQRAIQEYDATLFAHYALHPGFWGSITLWCRRHKILTGLILSVVLLLIGLLVALHIQRQIAHKQETYFVTPSGSKYHTSDCSYIQGKEQLSELPLQQLEEEGYTPCDRCCSDP